MRNTTRTSEARITGLVDIGTAKTACLVIEQATPLSPVRVLAAAAKPTRGLKAGVVVEMDGVEQALRAAVGEAERQAGFTLHDLTLAVACGRIQARTFAAECAIQRYTVSEADIARLMTAGEAYASKDGRLLLSLDRVSCRVDGASCGGDPNGIAGKTLSADLVAVTADEPPIRNLMHVVDRAGFATEALIPSPLAAGYGATNEAARRHSVIAVEIGAGTTQLAMFAAGKLLVAEVIPVGGNHITFDIARALSASLLEAERIKKDYGTLDRDASAAQAVVTYRSVASSEAAEPLFQTTKEALRRIIEARVANLFQHVAERIERSGLAHLVTGPLVLSGGTSLVPGMADMAASAFGRPAEVAVALPLAGLPAEFSGPAFATVTGMALVPPGSVWRAAEPERPEEAGGYLQRVGQWLRGGI